MAADGSVVVEVVVDQNGVFKGVKSIKNQFGGLEKSVKKLGGVIAGAFGTAALVNFAKESLELNKIQVANETKLATVMRQRMNATDEEIKKVLELTSAEQERGVIGDEVQIAGLQQLATFATTTDTIKELLPAMNSLVAQQNGLEASTGSAVSVANLMGKALQGQTSALTRVGIVFSEAEEKVLKFGTEEEKAATLAQVITNNVGKMNYALAQTDIGKQQQLANTFGDVKEQFGAAFQQIAIIALPVLSAAVELLSLLADGLNYVVRTISNLFGGSNDATANTTLAVQQAAAGVGDEIGKSVENQDALTDATKETAKAQKAMVASFDEINKLSSGSSGTPKPESVDIEGLTGGVVGSSGAFSAALETEKIESGFDRIQEVVKNIALTLLTWKLSGVLLAGINKILGLAGKTISTTIQGNIALAITGLVIAGLNISEILAGNRKAASGESFISELLAGLGLGTAAAGAGLTAAGVPVVATLALAVSLVVAITEIVANWDLVKEYVSAEWEGIKKIFTGDWEGAEINFTEAFMAWMDMDSWSVEFAKWLVGDDNWEAARKALEEGRLTVFDGVKAIRDDVTGFFGDIWDKISGFFGKLGNKFNEDIEFLKTGLVPNLKTALNPIKWLFGDLDTNANGSLNAIIDHINGFIEKVAGLDLNGAATPFKDFTNGLIERFEAFANRLISGINALITKLNSFKLSIPSVPFLGIEAQTFGFNLKTLQTISIPRLAQGAVIPPNREFMAVLGDQKSGVNIETPLSTMIEAFTTAMQSMGMSSGQTVVMQIDGREFGRFVNKYGVRESNRVGVSLTGVK